MLRNRNIAPLAASAGGFVAASSSPRTALRRFFSMPTAPLLTATPSFPSSQRASGVHARAPLHGVKATAANAAATSTLVRLERIKAMAISELASETAQRSQPLLQAVQRNIQALERCGVIRVGAPLTTTTATTPHLVGVRAGAKWTESQQQQQQQALPFVPLAAADALVVLRACACHPAHLQRAAEAVFRSFRHAVLERPRGTYTAADIRAVTVAAMRAVGPDAAVILFLRDIVAFRSSEHDVASAAAGGEASDDCAETGGGGGLRDDDNGNDDRHSGARRSKERLAAFLKCFGVDDDAAAAVPSASFTDAVAERRKRRAAAAEGYLSCLFEGSTPVTLPAGYHLGDDGAEGIPAQNSKADEPLHVSLDAEPAAEFLALLVRTAELRPFLSDFSRIFCGFMFRQLLPLQQRDGDATYLAATALVSRLFAPAMRFCLVVEGIASGGIANAPPPPSFLLDSATRMIHSVGEFAAAVTTTKDDVVGLHHAEAKKQQTASDQRASRIVDACILAAIEQPRSAAATAVACCDRLLCVSNSASFVLAALSCAAAAYRFAGDLLANASLALLHEQLRRDVPVAATAAAPAAPSSSDEELEEQQDRLFQAQLQQQERVAVSRTVAAAFAVARAVGTKYGRLDSACAAAMTVVSFASAAAVREHQRLGACLDFCDQLNVASLVAADGAPSAAAANSPAAQDRVLQQLELHARALQVAACASLLLQQKPAAAAAARQRKVLDTCVELRAALRSATPASTEAQKTAAASAAFDNVSATVEATIEVLACALGGDAAASAAAPASSLTRKRVAETLHALHWLAAQQHFHNQRAAGVALPPPVPTALPPTTIARIAERWLVEQEGDKTGSRECLELQAIQSQAEGILALCMTATASSSSSVSPSSLLPIAEGLIRVRGCDALSVDRVRIEQMQLRDGSAATAGHEDDDPSLEKFDRAIVIPSSSAAVVVGSSTTEALEQGLDRIVSAFLMHATTTATTTTTTTTRGSTALFVDAHTAAVLLPRIKRAVLAQRRGTTPAALLTISSIIIVVAGSAPSDLAGSTQHVVRAAASRLKVDRQKQQQLAPQERSCIKVLTRITANSAPLLLSASGGASGGGAFPLASLVDSVDPFDTQTRSIDRLASLFDSFAAAAPASFASASGAAAAPASGGGGGGGGGTRLRRTPSAEGKTRGATAQAGSSGAGFLSASPLRRVISGRMAPPSSASQSQPPPTAHASNDASGQRQQQQQQSTFSAFR